MLPAEHAAALSAYDAVIVPSYFCADVINDARKAISPIVDAGKVHVVPHCFDEDWWPHPAARTRRPDEKTRFLSIGTWGERKNMLGVLRAYLHEFTRADNVQLMLVISNPDLDEIRSVLARSGIPSSEWPEIHVPEPRELSEQDIVELHQSADAFVTATRGEGWGLGMFEAMILGKEVIAPMWGGHQDFLSGSALHRFVHGQLTPCFGGIQRGQVVETEHGLMQRAVVALPPGVDCKQHWYEPDLLTLASQMRTVYRRGYAHSQSLLDFERETLEARFGYRTVGPKLSNTLKEIAWGSHASPSTV